MIDRFLAQRSKWLEKKIEKRKRIFLEVCNPQRIEFSSSLERLRSIADDFRENPSGLSGNYFKSNSLFLKSTFTEALLDAALLSSPPINLTNEILFEAEINNVLHSIEEFYSKQVAISAGLRFLTQSRSTDIVLNVQNVLDDRLKYGIDARSKSLMSILIYGILLPEIYVFARWHMAKKTYSANLNFKNLLTDVKKSCISIILSATQADRKVALEERNSFEFYLMASLITVRQQVHFRRKVNKQSVLLKSEFEGFADEIKFLFWNLALTIITCDHEVDSDEVLFLQQLRDIMGKTHSKSYHTFNAPYINPVKEQERKLIPA